MREPLFIKKNKARWERIAEETTTNPDVLATDFSLLLDDLSYAKTFYPSSPVTRYLNALAAKIYLGIYNRHNSRKGIIKNFFWRTVPAAVFRHRQVMLLALAVFFVFFGLGFFSAWKEPHFVRQVLGDSYVSMTERNISAGNPFHVYADTNPVMMWLRIMVNNIMVSFSYFFRGILFGIPSLVALGKEAMRLGAFEHMFYSHNLGGRAVVTVLLHGLLELTAIIITCGAGIIMGKAVLFPGTYTRLYALRMATVDAIKIIVGLMPVFAIAAFIEGFVTRHYKMSLFISVPFLLICGAAIIWYFAVNPQQMHEKEKKALPV